MKALGSHLTRGKKISHSASKCNAGVMLKISNAKWNFMYFYAQLKVLHHLKVLRHIKAKNQTVHF